MSDYRVNLSEFIFFPSSFSNLEKYVSRYKTTRPIRHANLTTYVHVASTQARPFPSDTYGVKNSSTTKKHVWNNSRIHILYLGIESLFFGRCGFITGVCMQLKIWLHPPLHSWKSIFQKLMIQCLYLRSNLFYE